jgi:endonuclease I
MIKRFLFLVIGVLVIQSLFADIPNGYYDAAAGKEGYELKTALHNIIKSGHTAQDYGDLYDAYVIGDTDPDDSYVWDMYSENPNGADPYNYEHYVNNCGNYSSEGDCLNREHLFPQGIFNSASPMKTDYHHVVPSDGKVNGQRNNYPFGEVGSASWTSLNGSKLGTCNYPGYSGTVFEPIDEFKGDIARCMLYFATRYEDKVASWSHTMLNGTSDQVYVDWFISLLIEWHTNDPVDAKDLMRNEAGYDFQGNRNPFIDYPGFVDAIFGSGTNPTGITKRFELSKVKIYPNPAKEEINIENENSQINSISIFNLIGEKVLSQSNLNNTFLTVKVEHLPKGIYFIQVECTNSSFVQKVVLK